MSSVLFSITDTWDCLGLSLRDRRSDVIGNPVIGKRRHHFPGPSKKCPRCRRFSIGCGIRIGMYSCEALNYQILSVSPPRTQYKWVPVPPSSVERMVARDTIEPATALGRHG